jgi:hypothetical protein
LVLEVGSYGRRRNLAFAFWIFKEIWQLFELYAETAGNCQAG